MSCLLIYSYYKNRTLKGFIKAYKNKKNINNLMLKLNAPINENYKSNIKFKPYINKKNTDNISLIFIQ